MNKIGEFEPGPLSLVLALVGAGIALFTINGGFNHWDPGMEPGAFMKIIVTAFGGAIGFVWGSLMN